MIDETKIKEIVQKIANKVKPEKIILFGSYAHGNPGKHSDLDLCVVVDDKADKKLIYEKAEEALRGFLVSTDIIVYSQNDFEEWEDVRQAFPTTIMRTGKVLYEKKQD